MNRGKIIIFTDKYPYGSSESFFTTELKLLSNTFEGITIWPLTYGANINPSRTVPSNIGVLEPAFCNYKSISELLIKGILNRSIVKPFFREFFSSNCLFSKSKLRTWVTTFLLTRHLISLFSRKLGSESILPSVLYFYWGLRWSQVIPFLSLPPSTKIIVRFHGSDLYENMNGNYIPFRESLLRKLDLAVFISEMGLNYLKTKYPIISNKCVISRIGTNDFGLNPIRKTNRIHIVSCSNIIPLKRVYMIAESLRLLSIPVKWTHIGDGVDKKRIVEIALTFSSNVEWNFTGSLLNEEIMQFYSSESIDIFINVSSSEGVPVSVMEALSFGIPILATDVGGTNEIVNNSVGTLVKSDITPKELAYEILALISNPRYLTYRVNARKQWELICNSKQVYSEFINILVIKTQ